MAIPDPIHGDDDRTHTLYLVFTGLYGHAGRGTADLLVVTASADEARNTFRAVRLRIPEGRGWAELTAVSGDGRTTRLSWFGVDRWPRPNPLADVVRDAAGAVSRPWWRPRLVAKRALAAKQA